MSIRINKFLSNIGYCSRRVADSLISDGKVYIDGKKVQEGTKINKNEKLYVNGKFIAKYEDIGEVETIILALNKPKGIVCTTGDKDRALNIVDYVNYKTRVYPIGRLDKDSQGLILLTNKGDIVNALMKASNYHEKEYLVTLDRTFDDKFIEKMREGVYLPELKLKTRACRVKKISGNTFSIVLTQGLNRQIRRMSKALGYTVIKLERVRIMDITLKGIEYGKYRNLDKEEIKSLYKKLGIEVGING